MAQVNSEDKIIYEKSDTIEISTSPVSTLKGNQIIGVTRTGDIQAEAPQLPSIAKPFQSPNFKQGVTGWRLNSNGVLEANGAIIT